VGLLSYPALIANSLESQQILPPRYSLLLLGVVSVVISSYSLTKRGNEEVLNYRDGIMEEKKAMLTYLVDTA